MKSSRSRLDWTENSKEKVVLKAKLCIQDPGVGADHTRDCLLGQMGELWDTCMGPPTMRVSK